MAKEFAKPFYNSKTWKKCREGYIQSVQGLCETCLEKGEIRPGKILHHKKPLTPKNIDDPFVTLNWNNLVYMCLDCHNEEHGVGKGESMAGEGLMFNELGQLVRPPILSGTRD